VLSAGWMDVSLRFFDCVEGSVCFMISQYLWTHAVHAPVRCCALGAPTTRISLSGKFRKQGPVCNACLCVCLNPMVLLSFALFRSAMSVSPQRLTDTHHKRGPFIHKSTSSADPSTIPSHHRVYMARSDSTYGPVINIKSMDMQQQS